FHGNGIGARVKIRDAFPFADGARPGMSRGMQGCACCHRAPQPRPSKWPAIFLNLILQLLCNPLAPTSGVKTPEFPIRFGTAALRCTQGKKPCPPENQFSDVCQFNP